LLIANCKFDCLAKCRIETGIMGYKFFRFERSVTFEFVMAVVDQTMNIMMSMDEEWLSEMNGRI
jgi:hypothetical protein